MPKTQTAQMVKNPPAMRETWVQSLGWEDPLEKGKAAHSSIFLWGNLMDRGAWQATVHGVTVQVYQESTVQVSPRVRLNWATFSFHFKTQAKQTGEKRKEFKVNKLLDPWTLDIFPLAYVFSVVGLEGIVLNERNQRVSNSERYHLHVKSKKVKLTETENTQKVITRGWGLEGCL